MEGSERPVKRDDMASLRIALKSQYHAALAMLRGVIEQCPPRPYTKSEVLAYWDICDELVDQAVDTLDLNSPNSGFSWYQMPKLEHEIMNIRHIQHHTAQLADRLRFATDAGTRWIRARP